MSSKLETFSLRKVYQQTLLELGEKYPDIVVLNGDLSTSTGTSAFQKKFSDRHFNMGIAESNLILHAAGISKLGKTVFVSTFAMFGMGRGWEFIRNTIAHDSLNVKMVFTHAGISVGKDGSSHQTLEDIGLARILPNIEVLSPGGDPEELKDMLHYVISQTRPFYIRLSREVAEILPHIDAQAYRQGRGSLVHEGKSALVISTGIMTSNVYLAIQEAEAQSDHTFALVHLANLTRLDKFYLQELVRPFSQVITVEEHSTVGGLGDFIGQALSETTPKPHIRIGITAFGISGEYSDLLEYFDLSPSKLAKRLVKIVSTSV